MDHERGIHNGQPTLHARNLEALAVRPGQHVLHVGAGTGYYSAILAELTGPAGHVHSFEIDILLAGRARQSLAGYQWVTVAARSGTSGDLPPVDAIYVNAGVTQPDPAWLDALRPGGRLLFPLQPERGFGAMLLLEKPLDGAAWPARFVCRAGFIACRDTPQDAQTGAALNAAFAAGGWRDVKYFYRDGGSDEPCWLKGHDWRLTVAEA